MHHIGVLVMKIKKVDFMGQQAAVKTAFFNNNGVEAIGIGVDHTWRTQPLVLSPQTMILSTPSWVR